MASTFVLRRRVEFSETDLAGIVHYSNFFRYMEAAEHAFFRSLGHSVAARPGAPQVGWPRVHASCDYHQPLRFEEEFEIHLEVVEKRSKSLTYAFRFLRPGAAHPDELASGRLTVVCVAHRPDGSMKAVPIPPEIANRIHVAPSPDPESHPS
ncbi:MAG: acyl-CoA thioesterase [Verrucomicrobiae bacterium]|nr:acyl-CoA thioesterase [Verrucomicrobiae bacterium]